MHRPVPTISRCCGCWLLCPALQFVSQALNATQTRLEYDSYLHFLNSDM